MINTIDRATLRLSATLLLVGQLLYVVVTLFHTGGEANDHHETERDLAFRQRTVVRLTGHR